MVLMAGFILSSFPPERISRSPHQRTKRIDKIPAAKTKSEIASKINSPKSIRDSNKDAFAVAAYVTE